MSKIQIIRNAKDEPAFAVLPWAEYQRLSGGREDAALIARGNAARDDEKFPVAVARRLVAGDPPVKVFREWRQLTQQQLSTLSGVANQYISQIERGVRGVGKATAKKLAPALHVSIEALLD